MVEKGYDELYGARPLKRTIQSKIEDRLAEELLDGKVKEGDNVFIDLLDGELVFNVK